MGYFRIGSLKIINEVNGIRRIVPGRLGNNFGYGYNFQVEEETEYQIRISDVKHNGDLKIEIDGVKVEYMYNMIYHTKSKQTCLKIKIYIEQANVEDFLYLGIISVVKKEKEEIQLKLLNKIKRSIPLKEEKKNTIFNQYLPEKTYEEQISGKGDKPEISKALELFPGEFHKQDLKKEDVGTRNSLKTPKISIILPTYNGQKYLRESLNSIVNQTYDDFELIIVDDGSDAYKIEDILTEYKDDRIILIKNERNLTTPVALNRGFAHSRGELLTWTSDDNEYHLDFLEKFVERFETNPLLDFLYCFHVNHHWNGRKIGMCRPYGKPDDFLLGWRGMAGFMWRRRVYEMIGDFDQNLFGIDDWDYAMRIVFSGFNYSHISKVLYKYRTHRGNMSHKLEKEKKVKELEDRLIKKLIEEENIKDYFGNMNKDTLKNLIAKSNNKTQRESIRNSFQNYLKNVWATKNNRNINLS